MTKADKFIVSYLESHLMREKYEQLRNSCFCKNETVSYDYESFPLLDNDKTVPCWKKFSYKFGFDSWCPECKKRQEYHKQYRIWNVRRSSRLAVIRKYAEKFLTDSNLEINLGIEPK